MAALIGTYNRIDGATLSGGSWTAGLPLNNLKTRILGQVARTTNALAASSIVDLDLGDIRAVRVVSLVNHNISLNGTIRIKGGSTASVLDYDSGDISVWPSVYGPGYLEWENNSWWSGTYTEEELTGYTTNICHILPDGISMRYWKIEITDTSNPAGYVQLGRVFIGAAWQPERDAEVGLSIGWETNTTVQKALNGTKYYQRRNPYRVTKFTLSVMSEEEAMAQAFELDRRVGIDGEVLWIENDQDTIHALRRRFLGTLRELSPIEFPYSGIGRKGYVIEEIV